MKPSLYLDQSRVIPLFLSYKERKMSLDDSDVIIV